MTISRSSTLSINELFIFYIHDLNGALSLKVSFLLLLLALLVPVANIVVFATIYASLYSHKSDFISEVLKFIFSFPEC